MMADARRVKSLFSYRRNVEEMWEAWEHRSWSTGPVGNRGDGILGSFWAARVAENFDDPLPGAARPVGQPYATGGCRGSPSQGVPLLMRRFGELCASRVCVLRVLRFARVAFGVFAFWAVCALARFCRVSSSRVVHSAFWTSCMLCVSGPYVCVLEFACCLTF